MASALLGGLIIGCISAHVFPKPLGMIFTIIGGLLWGYIAACLKLP